MENAFTTLGDERQALLIEGIAERTMDKLVLRDILVMSPQIFRRGLKKPFQGYGLDATSLENEGDLEELFYAIQQAVQEHNPEILREIVMIFKFAMASYGVLSWKEFMALSVIKKFSNRYPKLTETFTVWAWG